MKETHTTIIRKTGAALLFSLSVIFYGGDISEAKFLSERNTKVRPRGRIGCYPTATWTTNFRGLKELGEHGYRHDISEKRGIVYTCKAGHIDITHVRKAADWTAYLASKIRHQLRENKTSLSFKLKEPTLYFVEFTYPENWKDLPEQEREEIVDDVSIRLGQYFSYTGLIWHEIITWFGYKCVGFFPERPSAFSWEDAFSDVFGTHIGAQALRDTEHKYDEAVTLALDCELKELGIQTGRTARHAAKKMRGIWYSESIMPFGRKRKRNFDTGHDDGFVTPLLVPSVPGCEGAEPKLCPVPNLEFLSEFKS